MGYLAQFLGLNAKKGSKGDLTNVPDAPEGCPTPDNPGKIVPFRSMPMPEAPRYFDEMEAQAIDMQAQKRKQMVASTQKGYKGLETVVVSDAAVADAHYKFKITDAIEGLKQAQSQAQLQSVLMDLKPGYKQIETQLEFNDQQADKKIEWIENDLDKALAVLAL